MQRVVAILESVCGAAAPTTAARVVQDTELSHSTVSRIMRELTAEGMLERFDDGTHVLGTRVFELAAGGKYARLAVTNRVLQDLRDLTGETVSLCVRRGDQRVVVASATSRHQLRRFIPIGDSMNLVGTVPGDIFLAQVPADERDALVAAVLHGRERVTQLERIRTAAERGYAAYGSEELGLTGVAVPVTVEDGPPAALALSGPSARVSLETAESWVTELQAAAKRLAPWTDADGLAG